MLFAFTRQCCSSVLIIYNGNGGCRNVSNTRSHISCNQKMRSRDQLLTKVNVQQECHKLILSGGVQRNVFNLVQISRRSCTGAAVFRAPTSRLDNSYNLTHIYRSRAPRRRLLGPKFRSPTVGTIQFAGMGALNRAINLYLKLNTRGHTSPRKRRRKFSWWLAARPTNTYRK